jgi:hypothetical protein
MTLLPRGVKVHLAFGFIDMRKGLDGLAMLVLASASSPNGLSTACSCGRRTSNLAGR